ncbi:hypothetical protein E4U56_002495 [Claviceps arundinis]|uniref:Uncharacterized protein n=1 Tax=Claviceps arundinis TaxID=1623583 RepID=A0A9P7SNT2_9HYPO|nr:hypothetical protein E4U56_002495 [Claviceps arundinis]
MSGTCPRPPSEGWSHGNGGGKKNQTHNFQDPQGTRQRLYGFDGGEDEEDFLGDEVDDDDDVQEHFNHVENANVDNKRRRAEVLCMSSNTGNVAVKTKRVRCDTPLVRYDSRTRQGIPEQ